MDARKLLEAGPDGYTAARDAEVRRLRAEGQRDEAAALKALGKPTAALWAVLAAGDAADVARKAVEATIALAEAQAAAVRGSGATSIPETASARRRALDAITDAGVAALERHGKRASGHRDEIRTLVDRVTRHPDLLAPWLDGTLRDVPSADGFDAFAAIVPATRPAPERRQSAPEPRQSAPEPPSATPSPRSTAAAERRRHEAERRRRTAEAALAAADAALAEAEGDAAVAEQALRNAQKAVADAEKRRDAAHHALGRARDAREAAARRLESATSRAR